MRKIPVAMVTLGLVMLGGYLVLAQTAPVPPPWAFPTNPPPVPGAPPPAPVPALDMNASHRVPGSDKAMTLTQIRDAFNVPDWHPEGHPPMPEVVGKGRRPDVRGCGYCHYPNGKGRPENASVAGLPASYIIQQVAEFKSGARKGSEPRMVPTNLMVQTAKGATDEEVRAAAAYFASLKWTPWIKVVEAANVPKTTIAGGMFVPKEGSDAGMEPLGQRILEMPVLPEQTETLRDDAAPFIAYVPIGSIRKGQALVTSGVTNGGGKTTACAVCHGANLEGIGPVPPLAGRSPSYTVRQLFDIQHGTRNGLWTDLMKPVVAKLTVDDMINIAAYTASRAPGAIGTR
jgi:cytochrome c553